MKLLKFLIILKDIDLYIEIILDLDLVKKIFLFEICDLQFFFIKNFVHCNFYKISKIRIRIPRAIIAEVLLDSIR